MSAELRPLGVNCNIKCQYCYQNPQRDAGNTADKYDLEKMKSSVEKSGTDFTLFGGEALLVPESDLEALWSWGFKKYGKNGVQTNGTLINENHIRMFKEYNVNVGISVDGPDSLNDVRWNGTLDRTRTATLKTHEAIKRLCDEGIPPGVIITLHRANATKDKLPIMHDWIRHLDAIGVESARLHILESENDAIRDKYALTIEENIEAFRGFSELESELVNLRLDVFEDMRRLLLGQDKGTTCVWNACDPYTTKAVQGIEGNGETSNCGRTNKDGIGFTKANVEGFERYIALYHTSMDYNGCKDCRFFLMCKGQCPGTAVDGDWRNRTEHCEVWMKLYEVLEQQQLEEGNMPLSLHPLRKVVEEVLLSTWIQGGNASIAECLQLLMEDEESSEMLHNFYESNNITHTYSNDRVIHVDHISSRKLFIEDAEIL